MPATSIYNEMRRISTCNVASEAALCIAKSARFLYGGDACGVFLLDYSNEQLILTASDAAGTLSFKNRSLPSGLLDDPLCFCMQTGRTCSVSLYQELNPFPSAACIMADDASTPAWISASPLVAPGKRTIGGLLIAGTKPPAGSNSELELYCLYASAVMQNILQRNDMKQQVQSLENDLDRLRRKPSAHKPQEGPPLIGQSEIMQVVSRQLEQIAASPAPVLLTGETGTGKGLAAKKVHQGSPRAKEPFVEINCGAMPAALLESELFGHVKGAFTGADAEHPGLFRSAHRGTIFLDEIGELPLNLQTVLLHVLQEKTVRPVGGLKTYDVDVRIISATNIDLIAAVEEGRFRRDLYHRISTVVVHLPRLEERREDIPLLAGYFMKDIKKQYNRPDLSLSPQALQMLMSDRYPGNIRELAGRIEAAVMLCDASTKEIMAEHFQSSPHRAEERLSLPDYVARQEAILIGNTMQVYDGSIQKSADALGVPRRTLARKVDRYGLKNVAATVVNLASENKQEA